MKHFALNNHETHRIETNVSVDDRTLYEIYLPAFRAAVKDGDAWSIMGAYNLYSNQHLCHNRRLLVDVLKGEWDFDGAVISDWGGCLDTDEAITNGLDLEFGSWTDGLKDGMPTVFIILPLHILSVWPTDVPTWPRSTTRFAACCA